MKTINFTLSICLTLALNACMNDNDMDSLDAFENDGSLTEWSKPFHTICPTVTDAVMRPVPWTVDVERTFTISEQTIQSMSTCGLLVTMLEFPTHPSSSNSFYNPSFTYFNSLFSKNKVAVEFFNRSDCFPVIASKYLTLINDKENECHAKEGGYQGGDIDYIEKVLASDLCMSVMNDNKKNQIMTLALAYHEKNNVCDNYAFLAQTYTIMISILLWEKYTPFIEEVGPRIREGSVGYYLIEPNGDTLCNCLLISHVELIVKHAKEFLNEQKK